MADDLDEVAEPEELDELPDEELEELPDEDLEVDLEADEDDELVDDELDVELPVADDALESTGLVETPAAPAVVEEGDEEEDEVEDEDVEASLDEILKERLVVEEEEDEDEEVPEPEDRAEISERVLPKQPDEFVCSSCFLVKHSSQLADRDRGLCRDCV